MEKETNLTEEPQKNLAVSEELANISKIPMDVSEESPKEVNIDKPESKSVEKAETSIDYEAEARKDGWKPKSEYAGDLARWRPAKEFVERGELLKEISDSHKRIKKLEEGYSQFSDYLEKTKKSVYDKAVSDLQNSLARAAEEGDSAKALQINKELLEIGINQTVSDNQNTPQYTKEDMAEAQRFAERNKSWYNTSSAENEGLVVFAQKRELELRQQSPNISYTEILDKIEKEVAVKTSVKNPQRADVSKVDSGSDYSPPTKKFTFKDLNAAQKDAAMMFKRRGVMEVEEYVKSLVEMGELK